MSILKENLTFEAPATIWGIKYNTTTHQIVLETKDAQKQSTNYHVLDQKLNLIQTITPEENWLVSLDLLTDQELIVSTFEESESPQKKDVLIYDLNTTECQKIKNKSILEVSNNELKLIDHETNEVSSRVISYQIPDQILFPTHYNQESEHLKTFAEFLANTVSKKNIASVDYIEFDKHLICSYFCMESEVLNSYLLITDLEGNPVHQFVTGEKLNGIAFDTFFIVEHRLYYIANKSILTSISL